MAFLLPVLTSAVSVGSEVRDAVANVDMTGILSEIISLLPLVLPVIIGFIGVRKGISFLIGSLRRA